MANSIKRRRIRNILFCVSWLLLGVGLTASAAEYKLYINKDQSASNVIVFENNMSAIVTHTSEGMELTLPGVDVALRCKSTAANNTTESCVIAIEAATVATTSGGTTSGGTTSGGTTSGTTTSGGTTSGDCVVTTWNDCGGVSGGTTSGGTTSGGTTSGGTTSGGTTSGGTTSGGTTSGGTTSGGTGSCSSTGGVSCGSLNYGSAGSDATGNTSRLTVSPGTTVALPFTNKAGSYYGAVNVVPTSSPFPNDGSGLRMWWSKEAGGPPVSSNCEANIGREGTLWWDQGSSLSSACKLGSSQSSYFLNVALCISSYNDSSCSDPSVKYGNESASVYISGALQ